MRGGHRRKVGRVSAGLREGGEVVGRKEEGGKEEGVTGRREQEEQTSVC